MERQNSPQVSKKHMDMVLTVSLENEGEHCPI